MPVFISYSHSDEDFANKLATHLVKQNTHVWVDSWNLNVGDSILSKVQDAIEESSALLVILSKKSVESEWCRKEINSGLMRELEERKTILLPVLIDDCKVPLFLKEKMYADFRTSFDKGLTLVVDSLAKITNHHQSRVESGKHHVDWSMYWSTASNKLLIEFSIVEQAKNEPYTVLTQIFIECNELSTKRYNQYNNYGLDWYGQLLIVLFISKALEEKDIRLLLENPEKRTSNMVVRDENLDFEYLVKAESRRLGEDTGKDILISISRYLDDIVEYVQSISRPLSKNEKLYITKIKR